MIKYQRLMRPLATAMLVAGLAIALQGCVAVVLGGAAVGTFAATDRRTLGAQTEDKEIAGKANLHLNKAIGDSGHVDVTSYNRKVLLTGEVRDEQMKQLAEQEVRKITSVQGVMNELEIAGNSSLTSRSSDALITTKVNTSFIAEKGLNSNSIQVVTERGNVYLLGIVTDHEGRVAAEVASGVSGVQRVIKMFEYISDEQLNEMNKMQGARS